MTQYYKIDNNGFFIGITHMLENEEIECDIVSVRPPQNPSLHKPKWNGNEWIEGKTEEEFLEDAFVSSLTPTEQKITKAERELEIIELLLEMGLM